MNAPPLPTSFREAARAHVAAFFFHEDEDKRRQRERLIFLRNLASSRAARASGWSRDLFWIVNQIANQYAFAQLDREVLERVADQLTRLGNVATNVMMIDSGPEAQDDG